MGVTNLRQKEETQKEDASKGEEKNRQDKADEWKQHKRRQKEVWGLGFRV